ncbi:MAG: LysM peptidoglycan-binding domain-containing protein [Ignavibacteria bacterium]
MQNKFIINAAKSSYLTFLILILFSVSVYMSGCSSSEDEEVVTQRMIDSMDVYSQIDKSFAIYQKALNYNQSAKSKEAGESFESSLKILNNINNKLINNPENYTWKSDYDELAVSIVQDYISTQSEISANSLAFDFAKKNAIKYEKVEEVSGDRAELPDGSDLPLDKNSAVDGYIEFFTNTDRGKSFIDKTLYRSGKFFPIMRKILKFNNAPEELIYLSVQESGLSPTIMSKAGAVGLWQFMPATGYAYGLGQDEYRDDRMDMEKSTDAAARHLKDLYRSLGDWYLAFAAYNAGPGRVTKAIKKSGSRDFWTLRGFLPGETKNYVPSILALSFVFRDPEGYGFKNVEYGTPISFDRVNVNTSMTLQQVADMCEADIETIRELNSELTQDMVPDYQDYYQLRIPHKTYDKFIANYNNATYLNKSGSKSPEFAGTEKGGYEQMIELAYYKVKDYDPGNIQNIGSTVGKKKMTYQFKKTDAIDAIAVFYDVRPVEIRIWNNIPYGSPIKQQQNLNIYVTEEKYNLLNGLNHNGIDKSKKIDKKDINQTDKNSVAEEVEKDNYKDKQYTESKNTTDDKNSDSQSSSNKRYVKKKKNTENTESKNNDSKSDDNKNTVNKVDLPKKSNDTEEVNNNDNNSDEESENISKAEENEDKKSSDKNNNSNNSESNNDNEATEETVEVQKSEQDIARDSFLSSNNPSNVMVTNYTTERSTVNEEQDENTSSYTYSNTENVKAPEEKKVTETKKKTNTKSKDKTTYYTVSEGDNLTDIADDHGVSVNDLKEWNDLDSDKILVGQKLKLQGGSSSKSKSKTSTHTVASGENLTMIADEYNMSVSDLKEINDLNSDVIMTGQKLKVKGSKSGKNTNSGKKSSHKVKSGETLASISDKYNVSISNLRKWNKLKNDKILVGQVLKINP